MPTDAVWIIVTIPKKDFELNVLGKNNNRIRRTNLSKLIMPCNYKSLLNDLINQYLSRHLSTFSKSRRWTFRESKLIWRTKIFYPKIGNIISVM